MPYPTPTELVTAQKPYMFTLSTNKLAELERYKKSITEGSARPSRNLDEQMTKLGKHLSALSTDEFLKCIINTKLPKNFAENILVSPHAAELAGYNLPELKILAALGTVIPSYAYNDGAHFGGFQSFDPLPCLMGFVSAPLLKDGCPDLQAVSVDGSGQVIDQQKYTALLTDRLLPLLIAMSRDAASRHEQLSLTLPGLGCGFFSGRFTSSIRGNLYSALQDILGNNAHQLTAIKEIYLDTYESGGLPEGFDVPKPFGTAHKITFACVASRYAATARKQLSMPASDLRAATIVAADLLSYMGNDMWIDSRSTDEGVKGGSSLVLVQIACTMNPEKYEFSDFLYNPDCGAFVHNRLSWQVIATDLQAHTQGYASLSTPVEYFALPAPTAVALTASEAEAQTVTEGKSVRAPLVDSEKFDKLEAAISALIDYSKKLYDDSDATTIRAGLSGTVLGRELGRQLGRELSKLKSVSDPDSASRAIDRFQQEVSSGYNRMSAHRRLGCFHQLLKAISSALSAIKACFVTSDDQGLARVKVGETSHGFFGLTTRQQKVCDIQNALNEMVYSGPHR